MKLSFARPNLPWTVLPLFALPLAGAGSSLPCSPSSSVWGFLRGPASGQAGDGIPHERLAEEMLARNGQGAANPDTFDFEEFLAKGFVRVRIGLFDVYMSLASAQDKTNSTNYQRMLEALLDAEDQWLEWLEPVADVSDARKDLTAVQGWVRSVRGGQIAEAAARLVESAKAGERLDGNLYDLLNVKASTREVADRFAAYMGTGAALGLEREDLREPIVLAPTRRDFTELVSLAGWVYPDLRSVYWQPGVSTWTHFYVDRYKVLALEYAAEGRSEGDWSAGVAMDEHSDDGMAQQITQLAANSLIDNYYGSKVPPAFAGGLSVNLVIDIFGECNTRVDGDLRARRTEAFEVFVPGGASEGGVLPGISAETRWREEQGRDYFVSALGLAQRAGATDAKKKPGRIQHFQLINDDQSSRTVVSGPFLGSAAKDREDPGEEFLGDHLEFLRAYRTAFVHWIRTKSLKSAKSSSEAFAELLTKLANSTADNAIEQTITAVYDERPLSSPELDSDDLEGAFLTWLSKQ